MITKLNVAEIEALIRFHAGEIHFRPQTIDLNYHTHRLRKLALTYKLLTMTQTETK